MRVIRNGVFETNSSSTHSVSLINAKSEYKPKCQLIIKSKLNKLLFLRSLINEAKKMRNVNENDLKLVENYFADCLKIYCDENNLSTKEAEESLYDEFLRRIAKRSNNVKTEEDIVKRVELFKEKYKIEFTCDNFFYEGCLDMCDCGFHSISSIIDEFSLKERGFIKIKPSDFLSEQYAFFISEHYAGMYTEPKYTEEI